MSLSLKKRLHQQCFKELNQRIVRLQQSINDAQKAAIEDTKSSAGDKFETNREMLKQEIDKLMQQLSIAKKMLAQLRMVKPENELHTVKFGSLVETNEGSYYFASSLGKISLDDKVYFALSMISPIGQALADKQAGDEVSFMQRKINILTVV